MKVNFFSKILDHEGTVVREGKPDPANPNTLQFTTEPSDFPTVAAANAVGLGAKLDSGRVVILRPTMFDMTLQRICITALVRDWPDEKIDKEAAFQRWTLASRIQQLGTAGHESGVLDLTLDERKLLTTATDNWNGTSRIYFARCRELLDREHRAEDASDHADASDDVVAHKSAKGTRPRH